MKLPLKSKLICPIFLNFRNWEYLLLDRFIYIYTKPVENIIISCINRVMLLLLNILLTKYLEFQSLKVNLDHTLQN